MIRRSRRFTGFEGERQRPGGLHRPVWCRGAQWRGDGELFQCGFCGADFTPLERQGFKNIFPKKDRTIALLFSTDPGHGERERAERRRLSFVRVMILLSSRSQRTELATTVQSSQSFRVRLTVEKAFWRKGT